MKSCEVVVFLPSASELTLSPVGEKSQAAQCRYFPGTLLECYWLYVCVNIRFQQPEAKSFFKPPKNIFKNPRSTDYTLLCIKETTEQNL